MAKSKQKQVTLPGDLAERLEQEAAGQGLSESAYLRMIMVTLAAQGEGDTLLLLAQQS
tara:strand:- start:456 stop:629 length:174 start_codon:yes stop_codon:yes gene_type:complete